MQSETEASQPQQDHRWRRLLWLGGMVLAFLIVFAGLQSAARLLRLPPLGAAALGQAGILAVALAFARLDGDGFRNLGIFGQWKSYDAGAIAGIIGTHFMGSVISGVLLMQSGQVDLGNRSVGLLLKTFGDYETGTFLLIALGLALQSGVAEELLFRGYVITRLEKVGLPAWPAILLSALVFGLVHWPGYGFLPSMSKAVWFGIPTGAFFWYRRSLGPLITAHALMNFFGFATAHFLTKYLPNLPGL